MIEVGQVEITSHRAANGWSIDVRYDAPTEEKSYNKETETFIGATFTQAYREASTFAVGILLDADEKGVIPLENYDEPDKTPQPEIDTAMTAKEAAAVLNDADFDIPLF